MVALLAVRMIRPQKITLTRMWLTPLVFCLLMGWVIYANQMLNPAPPLEIVLALVLGGICGVPFGILRGMHTDVRPTDRRGVMYLGSSWITLLIFVVAFGLRFAIRQVTPLRGALSGAIGDALLAFAIAFIVASYVVIFRKYQRLTA